MRRLLSIAVTLLIAGVVGCQGGGRIHLIPQRYRDIPESRPLIWTADLNKCYWWQDDQEKVHISMELVRGMFMPEANRLRFAVAMDLDAPPAGRARNYQIRGKMINGMSSTGLATSYLTSLGGIVAVWNRPGKQLKGRFQVSMLQRQVNPLFGLSRPGQTLLLGDFVAVYNEAKGKAVRESAVAAATGESSSRPASQPATRPGPSSAG